MTKYRAGFATGSIISALFLFTIFVILKLFLSRNNGLSNSGHLLDLEYDCEHYFD